MERQVLLSTKLEKGRAKFAYECVKKAKEKLGEKAKEYKSYSKKIPMMILTNGLGQTLAFVKAKSKNGNEYELIYNQMLEYLKSDSNIRITMPNDKDLVEWVISCSSNEYRYITQELLAFLNWLKRFAEGMIKVDSNE